MHWALGHGLTILGVGSLVLLLGMAIPSQLSHAAELVLGGVIIFLGLHVWWDLRKKEAHFHYHAHDSMPTHAHWHSHQQARHHAHHHRPLMIGALHGLAGSSPLLAILPASQLSSPWLGMLYLGLFSLGVLLTMLAFGGFLGQAFWHLNQRGWMGATRFAVGALAVAVGTRMLLFA
jgi:cytochrome c biogenesis protein CcdA